jgi:hypothetical protein
MHAMVSPLIPILTRESFLVHRNFQHLGASARIEKAAPI